MTDNTQPEALMQLADDYAEASFDQGLHKRTLDDAPENARSVLAAAVRRQHARIAELEAQLESIGAGAGSEPVAWLVCTEEGDPDMVFLSQHEAQQYLEDTQMTTQQHPAQFDWATELLDAQGHVTLSAKEAHEIGARLRSMGDKLKAYEDLDEAASDVQLLRMGYAAARLEIESLQARIKTMAEEHADELMVAHMDGRMRAYVDADRADRAPADSVTAPAGGATGKNLLQVQAWVIPDGSGGGQFSWQKQDERFWMRLTPPAQVADSVLEDAARWQALPAFFEEYQIDALKLYRDIDAYLAAARKQGANHD